MQFLATEIMDIVGISSEELKELSKAQHNNEGDRKLAPLISPKKEGKFNKYSFSDLMLIYIYQGAKNVFGGGKDPLRHLNKAPSKIPHAINSFNKLNVKIIPEDLNPFEYSFTELSSNKGVFLKNLKGPIYTQKGNFGFLLKFCSNNELGFIKINISNPEWPIEGCSMVLNQDFTDANKVDFAKYNKSGEYPIEFSFDLVSIHKLLKRRGLELGIIPIN